MSLTANIQGYWALHANAADSTPNGNNLTNNGTITFNADGAPTGNSARINSGGGSSQWFSISNAAQTGLSLNSDFSIAGWLNVDFTSNDHDRTFVSKETASSGYHTKFQPQTFGTNSGLYAGVANGGGFANGLEVMSPQPVINVWFFVVYVYNLSGGSVTIYQNGNSLGTASGLNTTMTTNTNDFDIGRNTGSTGTDYWEGKMASVGVWSRQLTGAEVTTLYNGGVGLDYPFGAASGAPTLSLLGVGK